MAQTENTHDSHLGSSEAGAVGCGDEDLGELHGAEVVGPATEKGEGEEEEEGEGCEGVG